MRCRPWRWLWGLLPLALVVFLATIGERQRVERDLTVRTEQTLQDEGLGWAKLQFEGRDGVLGGIAPSKAERVLAFDIARRVHGVRVLRNDATTEVAVSPYTWKIQRDGDRIVLSGHMPDEAGRREALRQAKNRFPDVTIVDEMTIAPGAPALDVWARGTSFAVRQLGHLRTGVINLTDTTFDMVGQVTSPTAYKQLAEALTVRLPKGWTLGKNEVAIPTVEAYSWSFDRLDGDVVLNGYVPDEAIRSRLLAAVRKRYPNATVTDRMLVAGGAPQGFSKLVLTAIAVTEPLDEVRVTLQSDAVTVTGLAGDQLVAGDVLDRLSDQGAGFKFANKLRVKRTAPSRVDPYVWSARQVGDTVVLSGYVPDERARKAVLRHVKKLNPQLRVRDEMGLASGVPGGRNSWMGVVRRGLTAMAGLDKGFVDLSGTTVNVGGETGDPAAIAKAQRIVETGISDDFAVRRAFKLLEPEVDAEEVARLAKVAEEAERIRLANLAAAEEAERIRLADIAAEEEQERLRLLAEKVAEEAERIRLANLAAAEEAERVRLADIAAEEEQERLRLLAEKVAAEAERIRLANLAAAEEAERVRLADIAAEEEQERLRLQAEEDAEAERIRQADIAAEIAAEEDRQRKIRTARRQEYKLVAEYNGTPLDLWLARRDAKTANADPGSVKVEAFNDRAADSSGRLVLSGKVASPQMRLALRRAARSQFDGGVVDRLEVIDGAEDSEWQAAATQGLMELSRLRNGAVVVEQGSVELYGDAVSGDAARAVRSSITKEAPVRFKVSSLITAPKVLEKKAVEKKIEQGGTVTAGECGNLMNSVANLAPIQFTSESAELQRKGYATLDKLAQVAQKCPQSKVRVAGHTDARGPEAYNQKLSEERAESVLRYLADKGIARDRMRARGYGESQPLVSNETRADRAKNRRIEFTVTGN